MPRFVSGEHHFTCSLHDDLTIDVYPHSRHRASGLPFLPEGRAAFILDVHLGRLARYLRIAGFDTLYYSNDLGDSRIAQTASAEYRIVLTRDVGLLKLSAVRYGHWLRNTDSRAQFTEVIDYYGLRDAFKPL